MPRKRDVFVIDDLDTLKAISDPTRVAIIELLAKPRSVTQLAEALDVPRTRLYHHIELPQSKGRSSKSISGASARSRNASTP